MREAFGRGGYVWEGLADTVRDPLARRYGGTVGGTAARAGKLLLGMIVVGIVVIPVAVFLLRWGYAEWYVSTHCTMILGTRVCQQ